MNEGQQGRYSFCERAGRAQRPSETVWGKLWYIYIYIYKMVILASCEKKLLLENLFLCACVKFFFRIIYNFTIRFPPFFSFSFFTTSIILYAIFASEKSHFSRAFFSFSLTSSRNLSENWNWRLSFFGAFNLVDKLFIPLLFFLILL